jgi:hypothetical protein
VRHPLKDSPVDKIKGQRIAPPIRKRKKAIWPMATDEDKNLMSIFEQENKNAATAINANPLLKNKRKIILLLCSRFLRDPLRLYTPEIYNENINFVNYQFSFWSGHYSRDMLPFLK